MPVQRGKVDVQRDETGDRKRERERARSVERVSRPVVAAERANASRGLRRRRISPSNST